MGSAAEAVVCSVEVEPWGESEVLRRFVGVDTMDHQQWDPVVLRNPNGVKSAGALVMPKPPNRARVHLSEAAARDAKLAGETDVPKLKTVPSEMKKKIVTGRGAKNMTRDQLARAINEKPSVVRDYEEGRAVVDNKIVNKMERALGTKLR